MRTSFYGRGASFPIGVSSTGGVRESDGSSKVEEAIRIILGTQHGERVMRPDFGCNLRSLAFLPNNEVTANLACYYVKQGLSRWEPRIELSEVNVVNDNQQGALLIRISYRLKATQDLQSLVYPFYLERQRT